MPTMVLRKFLEEELTKFNPEDHLAEVLSPIFSSLNSGNTNSFPIGKLFSGKATTVSLLPKTDPTAIFVGKMTNSCQHYMGDSSEEAVIPVYTDPNAGLIIVTIGKDVKTVKAACFAWLSRKEDGSIDGLVLDSFEAPGKDCDKAFLPLIFGLAKGLNARGLNLYVGTGGHTPELLLNGYLVEAQDSPSPLTTDYEPYGDASEVYVINPDFEYTFNSMQNEANEEIEELNIGDYVEKWSSDLLEEFNKLPKVLEYIKKYGSVNAQYQEFFQTILENLNIDSLTSLAKYVDLTAKIIEYGGAYHNELANLNSILGLDITLDYEPWFASLDQLEKEVENMSKVAEYKIQLKAFFAALPVDEKNTETLKKIEAFFEDIYYIYKEPNFSYVTQFTTRLNQENLPIIEEYFDILGKIRSYHPTWFQGRELYQSHQILDTTPIQDGEVRTTLQSVKRWLEIYEIQEQNKSILAGYKEQLNQAIQSSPYLSTHDHLASKFKDIFERSTGDTNKGLPVLLQLLTSEQGLTREILAQIEKFFELYDQMLTVNNNTWTFNELQLASILDPTNQLLDTVNTSFIELEEKLEARKIATNLSFYKNRLKKLILTLNKNTSSVKTLEKIIKLGKEIDLFSENKDLLAIPIICSNLTKKSFHLIEEYFSLIERIEELKIPNWEPSLSNIADILNTMTHEENKPGVILDTLRDIINQHEASLEASSAIASSEESAPPLPETNEEVQIGGDYSPL